MGKTKIKLPENVRAQFAKWGRMSGRKGTKKDKANAGKVSGAVRRVKRQHRVDAAWADYKRERSGGGHNSKRAFVKEFFPRIRIDDLNLDN